MPNDDVRAIAERTIRHFGARHQIAKLLEELGELSTEAARELVGRPDRDAFAAECADVEIVLEQMRVLMGDELIEHHKRIKLKRLVDVHLADALP